MKNGLRRHARKVMPFSLSDMFVLGLIPLHTTTATTYEVKRLSHLLSLARSISSLFTGKGQRVFLGSCSVKCKLSLTGRGQAEGLTGEPSIQMMRGGNRESLSLHCVSITLKRKLIHSALNCMPRPLMCLPPISAQCGGGNI